MPSPDGWLVFIIGLGIIVTSFSLFDRSLPEMSVKSEVSTISQFVYRPWVMFLLGSAITLISMSVSISLGILVPLSQRGLVPRKNIIPYIMGANISTFIDTLLAAVLIGNPEAFTIVVAEMHSLSLVCAVILFVSYDRYKNGLLAFVEWLVRDTRHLALFMLSIFVVPLLLLILG
jgi:Na+/phosphate symporter